MKSKLQSSFDVGAIIEHIKAGMTANEIETDSKPLAVGDRRMIRLMDTAWFVGYQRWMSQSPPLIAFQHIHGALNLWYACGRLLPMDKEFLEQLVPMMACLGRGYTQQKWVKSLNQLSQQSLLSLPWTNLQIIRAMSALEHEIFRTKLLRKKRTLGSLDKALQYVLKYGYKGLAFGGLNESR
ncbi:hypothetical protein NpNSSI1_00001694 [Neofusicoccum parvum]|nr:hypothetical protein NpNSSI1_00001694 [Neofusicoccum parvum]